MKKMLFLMFIILLNAGLIIKSVAQVEVKGTGNTSATKTFETMNSSNTSSIYVRDDGNVGIGTATPGYPLDVNGKLRVSLGIKFSDSSYMTSANGTRYAKVLTVAQSGGDYTTINAALAATGVAGIGNPWLIRVMPGTYNENVVCKQYVHLKGAGKYITTITGFVTGADNVVIEDFYITKGVKCLGTSPTIIHNIITNGDVSGDGILVTLGGKPWIKENEIINCLAWGISSFDFGSDFWCIANKINNNGAGGMGGGGIYCNNNSPTISNNIIDNNHFFGISLIGAIGTPSEPTIDDNVIGHTDYNMGGIGIYMTGYCEPRIIANDIYLNECGIWINQSTQPSIIGNNINYNFEAGIRVYSKGASKRVVITGNHIHSNTHLGGNQPAGIWIANANPMITLNNITQNDNSAQPALPDIDYSTCIAGPNNFPMISLNVYDIINTTVPPLATGLYNVTGNGAAINP